MFAWEYVPEAGILHHTQLWPDDWGLEIGPTLYNEELSDGTRPLCGFDGGDPDEDFFMQTWNSSFDNWTTFVTWSIPEEAEPYVDSEITFDACNENSLEIGIGKPRELENNQFYGVQAWIGEGSQTNSPVSATMSAKPTTATTSALSARSSCMGLNTNAVPDYIVPFEILLNKDRGRTAPLRFISTDYIDQPFIVEPLWYPGPYCPL